MERGNLNFNQLQQQIFDMNMEITLFLEKFIKFRKSYNVINKELLENLELIYKEIEVFVDNDPQDIKANKTSFNINFLNENNISRIFVCNSCNTEVGDRYRDITKHIQFHPKHKLQFKNKDIYKQKNEAKKLSKQGSKEKSEEKKKKQLEESRKLPKKAKLFLSSDFNKFFNDALSTGKKLKSLPVYDILKNSIMKSIKSTYPDSKVHFFGSRINGLGCNNSDLDIFLEIGDIQKDNSEDISKKLTCVSKLIRKDSDWTNIAVIANARVPIVRAFNAKVKIDCDIGFSNALGEKNTFLMNYFFEIQPICQKMCIFLKKWLLLTTLKQKFSTYTLVLMAVYYLQTIKLLPSVKSLQNVEKPLEFGPWQGNFIEKSLQDLEIEKINDDNENCLNYLKRFFHFYAIDFDFKSGIVCPYLGETVLKHTVNNLRLKDMPRYDKVYKADRSQTLQLDTPICVQDPFELNHNVAKGIGHGVLQLLIHYLYTTYTELTDLKKSN